MIAIMVKTFYFQQLIASDVTRTQYCYFIWQIFFIYILIKVRRHQLVLNLQHNILQLTKIEPRLMVTKKINTQGWKVKKKRVVFYSSDLYFKNIYTCSYIYRFCFVILNTFLKNSLCICIYSLRKLYFLSEMMLYQKIDYYLTIVI